MLLREYYNVLYIYSFCFLLNVLNEITVLGLLLCRIQTNTMIGEVFRVETIAITRQKKELLDLNHPTGTENTNAYPLREVKRNSELRL